MRTEHSNKHFDGNENDDFDVEKSIDQSVITMHHLFQFTDLLARSYKPIAKETLDHLLFFQICGFDLRQDTLIQLNN